MTIFLYRTLTTVVILFNKVTAFIYSSSVTLCPFKFRIVVMNLKKKAARYLNLLVDTPDGMHKSSILREVHFGSDSLFYRSIYMKPEDKRYQAGGDNQQT